MAVDSGKEDIQHSDTNCWGRGRQCERSQDILWRRRTCVYEKQDNTHKRRDRERERDKEYVYIHTNATVTMPANLTKGYKVTLYALYAIYINSLN